MYTLPKALAIGTLGAILLGGCASDPFSTRSNYPNNNYPSNTSYPDNRNNSNSISYGVIDSIETVNSNNTTSNSSIGVGTVLGGVVGGVVGNQVGSGNGRTAATAVGAVGGAIIGHEIEKNRNNNQGSSYNYRVGVRLDNGGYDNVMQNSIGNLRVGDRVRIENSTVTRY
jgi:outer membrane lipoprotein SlyB